MNRKTNFKVRNNEWANQDILGTENGHREKEVTVDIINTLVVDFFFNILIKNQNKKQQRKSPHLNWTKNLLMDCFYI